MAEEKATPKKERPRGRPPGSKNKPRSPKGKGRGKISSAEMESMAAAPVYVSKTDLQRHIHESLRPIQRLADQAGMPFLSYLIGMAVEESRHDSDKS